jgi:hypothetical protein
MREIGEHEVLLESRTKQAELGPLEITFFHFPPAVSISSSQTTTITF